jgi:branched-chain amino acid transport system ATP-binding protein
LPGITIEQISKDFGGLRALDSVDIDVRQGEIFGLIGTNGSGKTTLFSIITGFLAPTEGDIYYNGNSIVGLRPDQIVKQGIGIVFQHNSIFPDLTAKENIVTSRHLKTNHDIFGSFFNTKAYWKQKSVQDQKAMDLLELVGINGERDVPAKNLPHGSQRVLQVAMALAAGPKLLLLDEPATGMNPEEALNMMDLIRSIQRMGMTVIIVEHNMRVIMGVCTRMAVLNTGVKIAEGKPNEVVQNEKVISTYLGRRKINA